MLSGIWASLGNVPVKNFESYKKSLDEQGEVHMGKFIVKYRKIMIGILIVLIYLAILTLVSFLRSTEIKVIGENLVNYQDFHAAGPEEGTAWIDDTGLHIRDAGTGAKVFSTEISLRDLQMIQAEFEVECPESFSGEALLHVDLFAEGYDTDEQEFTVSLHAGKNEASGIIDKGADAPDEAMLRIFCLEPVEWSSPTFPKPRKKYKTVKIPLNNNIAQIISVFFELIFCIFSSIHLLFSAFGVLTAAIAINITIRMAVIIA